MFDSIKTALSSRAAQLAGRLVAAGLACLYGHLHAQADPGMVAGLSADTAALAGSIAGLGFDLLVHYVQHGSVIRHTMLGDGVAAQIRGQ